jgi:nucleotide-binding universal stress UspA family protein
VWRRDGVPPRPCPPLLEEWEEAAYARLHAAFDDAFGGYPCDVRTQPLVIRAEAGLALVHTADRPDDLLVLSAGKRGRFQRMFHGSVSRYCLAHARCTVVAVPPSELMETLEHAPRSRARTTLPDLMAH